MTEEVINYRVEYDVQGIDQAMMKTQRYLYFMNALRLSVVDLQQVMSGPTISNMMWTAVQLTRVWTHLHRIIKKTNQAQRVGIAQSIGGATAKGVSVWGRRSTGQAAMLGSAFGGAPATAARTSLFARAMGYLAPLAPYSPYIAAVGVGVLLVAGAAGWHWKRQKERENWLERQREIAKSQGFEY